MTPIGHSLTGLSIGIVALPGDWPLRRRLAALPAFVVLANAPDVPLPSWGHDDYYVSHSLLANAMGVVVLATLVRLVAGRRLPLRVYAGGALAWFSHLLLDSFYNHGRGIRVCWPFGNGRLRFPISWFSTMQREPLFSAHNLRVWLIELAAYGTLLVVTLLAVRWFRRRSPRES